MIQTNRFRASLVASLTLALAGAALAEDHPVAPALSSLAGATYTLYLDFSGFTYSGTWDGGSPGNVPAYGKTAGDTTAFTAAQETAIRNAWAATAQKFVGFNVNVTTVDPAASGLTDAQRKDYYDGQAHMMHTIIGGSNSWYRAGTGGVSYVGVTQYAYPNLPYHTNWVFPENLGTPKNVAEATSHENGHGLGLNHQVDPTALNGYSTNNGASGDGSYAPTMGVGYSSQRSTWRSGTVRGSNGAASIQNDVQVLLQQDSMGSLLDSGIGHSTATATSLAVLADGTIDVSSSASKGFIVPSSSSAPTAMGEANYTSDYFKFRSTGGLVTLTQTDGSSFLQAGMADPGATLQGILRIYDRNGVVVGTGAQATDTLSRTFSGVLAAGEYYAQITSIGGVQSTYDANSKYYTMGAYFLKGSGFHAVPEPATMAALGLGTLAMLRRRRKSA